MRTTPRFRCGDIQTADQACLVHVGDGPVQPVGKQLCPTRDRGTQVIFSRRKAVGDSCAKLSNRVIAAVGEDSQGGRHQRGEQAYLSHFFCSPRPVGKVVPGFQGAGMVGAQDPLKGQQQCRELVASTG
jgi:hypothetical protein